MARAELSGRGTAPERALEAIKPSVAHSAKADPPQSFPASAGPVPRSTIKPQRSGIGPERALEAIKPSIAHSAKADPLQSFPASAGPVPRSPHNSPLTSHQPYG